MNYRKLILFLLFGVGKIFAAPYHTINVDGNLNDWFSDELLVADQGDSLWDITTDKNYIDGIYFTYDEDNLYLGIASKTTERGLLVYLHFAGLTFGATDLTRINTWNRQVKFSPYAVDYFYGSWNGSNGNFYRVENQGNTVNVSDVTGYVTVATSKTSTIPGSEIKIPFSLIYNNIATKVSPGAKVYIVASLATGDVGVGDFGAYGYLGGDVCPDNFVDGISTATLSLWATGSIDKNFDGIPDNDYSDKVLQINYSFSRQVFVVWREKLSLTFSLSIPAQAEISVYDFRGQKVKQLYDASANDLSLFWDGRNEQGEICEAGIYIIEARFTARGISRQIKKPVMLLR